MLEIKNDGIFTKIVAEGKTSDLLNEATNIAVELHRFIYQRLGELNYLLFLLKMSELTKEDNLTDFLEKKTPTESTEIRIPIPPKEEDK